MDDLLVLVMVTTFWYACAHCVKMTWFENSLLKLKDAKDEIFLSSAVQFPNRLP